MEPLFKYLDGNEYSEYVVVEPSDIFYQNAERQANEKITILNAEFGTNKIDLSKYHFDFVLCSSLLHEIPNDFQFLKSIYAVCQENTVVHINVPNAKSFHRILAKNAGLIRDEHDLTEKNIMYQQSRVYDIEALKMLSI